MCVCVCLESVLERCVGLLILWPCLSPCLLLLTTCFGYLAADSHPYLVLGFQFLSILSVDFLTIPRRCFLSPILTLSLISLLHTSLLLVPHHLFIYCLFFGFFVQLPFFPCLLCLCSNNTIVVLLLNFTCPVCLLVLWVFLSIVIIVYNIYLLYTYKDTYAFELLHYSCIPAWWARHR